MDVKFCGGAQEVTGSQCLFKVAGKQILLECGLFQGRRQETYERNQNFLFAPADIDAVVLSHAHMDHSGNLPNLVKKGFRGPIYATPATVDLCKIMLRDSAYLQARDVEWVNRIRRKNGLPPAQPLYTLEEAEATMEYFNPVEYDKTFPVTQAVDATFRDAGHILGAASVLLEIKDKGRPRRVGYSGDIGRPGIPLVRDPNLLRDLDVFITECTYGNRHHSAFEEVEEDLAQTVRNIAKIGGKIIIPSFAVGRTQLIVYLLHKLFDQNRIPEMPVFVDSPLACEATEVFRNHTHLLDRETNRIYLKDNEDPFGFRRLKYIREVEESKKLNGLTYPHIIISASGMAEGGRILHHLKNNIQNPNVMVLFIGYAARETLARKIIDGEKEVKIFGEAYRVKCRVKILDAFSAHADRKDLLNYLRITPPEKLKTVFLVHGEPDQAVSFRDAVRSNGYRDVYYPERDQMFTL